MSNMAATSVSSAVKMFFCLAFLTNTMHGASYTEHTTLINSLLTSSYSTNVRPVVSDTTSTGVTVILHLLSIVEVRAADQALVTNLKLRITWRDELLVWTPSSHGNINTIYIPQSLLWKPDIALANRVSGQSKLGHDDLAVQVSNTGIVLWTPTVVFETSCAIDISFYPLDTQRCSIGFIAEMSKSNEMRFFATRIDLDFYTENGEWEVADTGVDKQFVAGSSQIEFLLKLRRRRFFYVLNLILPVVFLSLTSSLVFWLPADAGEKVGLSVTVLLTYAVYLLLVSEALPKTSMQASVVAVYLMMLLGLCAFNVVLTVIILRLYHRSESQPLTGRVGRIILKLRRLLRYSDSNGVPSTASSQATEVTNVSLLSMEDEDGHKSQSVTVKEKEETDPRRSLSERRSFTVRRNGDSNPRPGTRNVIESQKREKKASKPGPIRVQPYQPRIEEEDIAAQSKDFEQFTTARNRSTTTNGGLATREEQSKAEEEVSGKIAAETVDYLLFLSCTIFSLGTTLVCMLVLVIGSETNALNTSLS